MRKFEDLRILVIDDSPRFLEQFSLMLAEEGIIKVKLCESAIQAKDILTNKTNELDQFDLVICDQHMDNYTGIDLLKILRESKSKEELPFFLVTSNSTKPNIIMMVQSGGNRFITKPPTKDDIVTKLIETFNITE